MITLFRRRAAVAAPASPPPSSTKKFTETEKRYLYRAALEIIRGLQAEIALLQANNALLRDQLAALSPKRQANGRFTKR